MERSRAIAALAGSATLAATLLGPACYDSDPAPAAVVVPDAAGAEGSVLEPGRDAAPADGAVPSDAAGDTGSGGPAGTAQWARRFVESGNSTPAAVAADPAGNVFVIGSFDGTVNFAGTGASGGEALTAGGGEAGFLAKLRPGGEHAWSKKFVSSTTGAYPLAVTSDAAGNVILAGQSYGSTGFGGAAVVSGGTYSAFVAKLDANGNHVWSKGFDGGGGTRGYAESVATDSAGDVWVTGKFLGAINFAQTGSGGAENMVSAGANDLFLAKLAGSDGHHLFSRRYGDAADQQILRVAVDRTNALTLVGSLDGSADFGGGSLGSDAGSSGFIAHLDAAANHQWSRGLPGAFPAGVAVAPDDGIVYGGSFSGTVDFAGTGSAGAEILTAPAGPGALFLTRLAATGAHQWSRGFSGSQLQQLAGVTVSAQGDATISGTFRKTPIAFSAGGVTAAPLACNGDRNVFVASFTAAGAHGWSLCAGTAGTLQQGEAIASGPNGDVFAFGDFYGTTPSIAFPQAGGGSLSLNRVGSVDAFLVKISR